MVLMGSGNPFFNGGVIEDPRYFGGRDKELREIFGLVGKPASISVSLVGPPKIGKSSLLRHVGRPEVASRFLARPEDLITTAVNFAQLAYYSEMECLQKILWEVHATLTMRGLKVPEESKIDPTMVTPRALVEAMTRVFSFLRARQKKLVFLFDEFELTCHNPHLSIGFFNTLRSFSSQHGVAYVVATRQELFRLPITRRGRSSPFFSYFNTLYLGLFRPEEAQELIRDCPETTGVSLAEDVGFVLEKAGRFPFFLQTLCRFLWEEKVQSRRRPDAELRSEALRLFLAESAPHFEHTWSELSDEERATALRMALGQPLAEPELPALTSLERRALLARPEGRPQLFSQAFADFVRATATTPGTT